MALPEPLDPVFVGDPLPAALNEERQAVNDLTQEVQTKISLPTGAAFGDLLRWNGSAWETTETRFLEGNGRPDGQVAAPIGSRYIDKMGAQGAVEWVKRAGGDTNTGWTCLAGDTGLRNIANLIDIGNGTVYNALVSRVGHVIDMHLDILTPSNRTSTWQLFASLAGFAPGYSRWAALQDFRESASTAGTLLQADGGVTIYGVVGNKRDRFAGTWTTRDPWPSVLPGSAA